jgi:site-specific DNA-methyltransferase (adenine-specific)
MNTIYFGDNLPILKTLPDASVGLIYIDPPFNTGKRQALRSMKTHRTATGDRIGFQGNAYQTTVVSVKSYLDSFKDRADVALSPEQAQAYASLAPHASVQFLEGFLRPRLTEALRVLKPQGSLYFHIDYREAHYCKILLDQLFGRESFINEIIWAYDFGGKAKSRWPAKHDTILFYAKDPDRFTFNTEAIEREPYMAPGLVGPDKAARGKLPTDTWWHTIVGTNSKERTGYPTQKPLGVIKRIIEASSNPGDVVLDFFAGSGVVGEACLKLGRSFILIDNNPAAIEVMARRFEGVENIKWVIPEIGGSGDSGLF